MDIMGVRDVMLSLPNVEETQPFGEDFAVYKIGGRMFALVSFMRPDFLAVKCRPDRAEYLRERYEAIMPAWHLNKRHWNDLAINDLPDGIVRREIVHSYLSVIRENVSPKALRLQLLCAANPLLP